MLASRSTSAISSKSPATRCSSPLVMAESAGVPIPGETGLIAAAVLASRGKLQIEIVIAVAAVAAIVGDNIGYQIGGARAGAGCSNAPGASNASAARCSRPGALLRAPRAKGRVLRALRARAARLGLVARRRDAHALALVLLVERAAAGSAGPPGSACSPTSSARAPERDRELRHLRPGRRAAGDRRRVLRTSPPPSPRCGGNSGPRRGRPSQRGRPTPPQGGAHADVSADREVRAERARGVLGLARPRAAARRDAFPHIGQRAQLAL